jgi:signal transduction histidine kinase
MPCVAEVGHVNRLGLIATAANHMIVQAVNLSSTRAPFDTDQCEPSSVTQPSYTKVLYWTACLAGGRLLQVPERTIDQHCIISMSLPRRAQTRLAASVVLILVAAVFVTAPFAQLRLDGTARFLDVYATIVFVNDVITSVMLMAVYSVQSSRAIFVVALGYLFTGLTIIPWVLTFPGVFSASGLLGAGVQATAAIAAARLYGFPLFMIVYALMKMGAERTGKVRRSISTNLVFGIISVVGLVCGLTWLSVAGDAFLPEMMASQMKTSAVWDVVLGLGMLLSFVALILLFLTRQSTLDLWLTVVLVSMLLENLLLGYLSSGRLSIGWWAGRIYGLTAASVVLCVLLSEMTTLYARLVHSVSNERREREARLMAMEALSASVAHEISQPLASMVTNAEAGLRWLDRPQPDLDETKGALLRVVRDGKRGADVIANIRTVFKKGTAERAPLSINDLIESVLANVAPDLRRQRVAVETSLHAPLPSVMGNAIQLQQVVLNLVQNASDAMNATDPETRRLCVRTAAQGVSFILVSVRDSGAGLNPQHQDQVFETIFTTKQHGSGMGLVISRSIVEAHGGRIWLKNEKRGGAVCEFTLRVDP